MSDGRNHVELAGLRYDVVISEPSNPWMAGVSALFTRDFFLLARARLNPGGLFCQWAHVYNMSERDLKTVIASFADAFPGAVLFLLNEGDVLLVGGPAEGPTFDKDALARRRRRLPSRWAPSHERRRATARVRAASSSAWSRPSLTAGVI